MDQGGIPRVEVTVTNVESPTINRQAQGSSALDNHTSVTPTQKESKKQTRVPSKIDNFAAGSKMFDDDYMKKLQERDPFKGSKDLQRTFQNEQQDTPELLIVQEKEHNWMPRNVVPEVNASLRTESEYDVGSSHGAANFLSKRKASLASELPSLSEV